MAYRFYVSECLRMSTESLAHAVGGGCVSMTLAELLDNKPRKQFAPGEIKKRIKNKLKEG